jgi:MFS family permease
MEDAAHNIMKSNRFLPQIYRADMHPLRFLSVLMVSGIAYGLYRGVQDNYLVEIVKITPFERGVVEFFREIPGLLVVFIFALLYKFTESKVFKIGIAIMLAGIAGLLFVEAEKLIVVIFMVLFSFGEHIIMPVKNSISLDLANEGKSGASLGITGTINNLGNIAGFLIVTVIFFIFSRAGFQRTDIVRFRVVFAASTALMIAAVLIALALRETKTTVTRRRFYFAKKFSKYYMLEVFYGARKQVFLTFAPLVLIIQYGADTSLIALLYAICAGAGMVASPAIGKIIDSLGYKFIMIADTLVLAVVCFFYGFSHHLFSVHIAYIVVCVSFVLDSILSLCSMASNVYVQSISDSQEEITATISTGISVNHVISIFIALLGGLIWKITGIEVLFSISAVLGLLNSLYAATIRNKKAPDL